MQEKLIKLIEIKIDAINKNIDNLNYLNKELEENNEKLDYLKEMLSLLDTNDILDFDKITQEDFEKILSLVDNNITEIFNEKTCNYQGIMYIIRGIRDGISLELTNLQEVAINNLIESIKFAIDNFNEIIANFLETKENLPETNLEYLETDLIKFKEIIEAIGKNEYLSQIEDIIEALEFSSISSLEKIDIFSFILKYNRDIYEDLKPINEDIEESNELPSIKIDNLENDKINFFKDEDFDLPSIKLENNESLEDLKTNLNDTVDLEDIIKKIDLKLKEIDEEKESDNEQDTDVNSIINELNDTNNLGEIKFDEELLDAKVDTNVVNLEDDVNEENTANEFNFSEIELPNEEEKLMVSPTFKLEEDEKIDLPTISLTNNDNIVNNNISSDIQPENNKENVEEFIVTEEPKEEINLNDVSFEQIPPSFQGIEIPATSEIEQKNEDTLKIDEVMPTELSNSLSAIENLPEISNSNDLETINENLNNQTSVSDLNKIPELLNNYELNNDVKIQITNNPNLKYEDLEKKLNLLVTNNVLNSLNEKNDLLYQTLLNEYDNLDKIIFIIKNDLAIKEENYLGKLNIILDTISLIFTNPKVSVAFINNIEFYKEKNINLINLFDNYRELFIIDTNSLKENYDIVKNYDLELNSDNVKYLLCNRNILENLDYYIEAYGYEKGFLGSKQAFDGISYIKDNPYRLNMIEPDTLMKLRYATENGLKIYGSKPGVLAGEIANPKVDILTLTPEYRNEFFKGEYEFIDRSEMINLNLKLDRNTNLNMNIDEVIEKLDKTYKISDLRYEINNIYFSRIKTIRLYNYLKTENLKPLHCLIIALTYKSVIKVEEYKKVLELITKLVEGGN